MLSKWHGLALFFATLLPISVAAAQSSAIPHPPPVPPKQKTAPPPPARHPSAFAVEQRMSFTQLMNRWNPLVATASKRFAVPADWLRAVMRLESGGRTMLAENRPIRSGMGAMGLMQLMPATYETMRLRYDLGRDPYDPHDNIIAAAAYLSWLKTKYSYPNLFAAYNDGPRNLEARLFDARLLPSETQYYLTRITARLRGTQPNLVKFTRPDGTPLWININASPDVSVRGVTPRESLSGFNAVVTVGRRSWGVWDNVAMAHYFIASHTS
jgi:soluble lytic murein transglycosylase-like protein